MNDNQNSQHTPGPWHVTSVPGRVLSADTSHVCDATFDLLTGDIRANAQLIAAAPDLLAALQFLTSAIDPYSDWDDHDFQKGLRMAAAAISRAKGRLP